MRILHAASPVAGAANILARHQREAGQHAWDLAYVGHDFGFDVGISFPGWKGWGPGHKLAASVAVTARFLAQADVFHLTAERTLLPRMADMPMERLLGKTVVLHVHGYDVCQAALDRDDGTFTCDDCPLDPPCSPRQLERVRFGRRFATFVAGSTPDVLRMVPGASYLPNSFEAERWVGVPIEPGRGGALRVLHAPSDPVRKGTTHVMRAVADLRAEGADIDLRIPGPSAHSEMRSHYAWADVVVDQLLLGWHGIAALEAMAMGKPVVAYIRDEPNLGHRPPPIINATRHTLREVLGRVYEHRELLAGAAAEGPGYCREVHDPDSIARRWIDIYRSHGAPA